MSRLEEHEEDCRRQLGAPCTLAHLFLDQFSAGYRDAINHRLRPERWGKDKLYGLHRRLLHNDAGIELIGRLFGPLHRSAAEIHVNADLVDGNNLAVGMELPFVIRKKLEQDRQKISSFSERFSLIILREAWTVEEEELKKKLAEIQPGLIMLTGHQDSGKALHHLSCVLDQNSLMEENRGLVICGVPVRYGVFDRPVSSPAISVHASHEISAGTDALLWNETPEGGINLFPDRCGGAGKPPIVFFKIEFSLAKGGAANSFTISAVAWNAKANGFVEEKLLEKEFVRT